MAAENIPGVKEVKDHLAWVEPTSGEKSHRVERRGCGPLSCEVIGASSTDWASLAAGQRSLLTFRMLFLDNQRGDPMRKPIPDKAEIALEYPDKLYVGTFECSSRFEAHLDGTGIALILSNGQVLRRYRQINSHAYQLWPVR